MAVKARKRNLDEYLESARELLLQGKWARADSALRKAISISPRTAEPWNLMGVMLELQGLRLEALRMYRGALAVDPTYTPADSNLERATRWHYQLDGIDMDSKTPALETSPA